MNKRKFWDRVLNKCEVCGYRFGNHNSFVHILKDADKAIEVLKNTEALPLKLPMDEAKTYPVGNMVNLSADIDRTKRNAVIIHSTNPDPLVELDYWIQAFGFMAYRAMKYQEWTRDKIMKHVHEKLDECVIEHQSAKK